jgi:transposase
VAFFRDTADINLSLGSIVAMEKRFSTELKAPYDAIAKALTSCEYLHMDETSWSQAGTSSWLWVATDKDKTLFKIAARRSQAVAKGLLDGFSGVLHSDRYAGYSWYPLEDRAYCHAHLKRDFQRLVDRGGTSSKIGTRLLELQRKVLDERRAFVEGTEAWEPFFQRVQPLIEQMQVSLTRGAEIDDNPRTQGFCRTLLRTFDALWTFLYDENIASTNNLAERSLRRAVIWRRTSQGTRSESGNHYVERILTVLETCRKQKRSAFAFLRDTLTAALTGATSPSLLPT